MSVKYRLWRDPNWHIRPWRWEFADVSLGRRKGLTVARVLYQGRAFTEQGATNALNRKANRLRAKHERKQLADKARWSTEKFDL